MDICNPICPHCGVEIDFFEHYDCYDDSDVTLCFATGQCPRCLRKYDWTDVYKWAGFQDLEEEDT